MKNTRRVNHFDFAERLKKSLKTSGVSVREMAHKLGVSETTVRNYTSGRIIPRPSYITIWSEITGADEDWFYEGLYGSREDSGR